MNSKKIINITVYIGRYGAGLLSLLLLGYSLLNSDYSHMTFTTFISLYALLSWMIPRFIAEMNNYNPEVELEELQLSLSLIDKKLKIIENSEKLSEQIDLSAVENKVNTYGIYNDINIKVATNKLQDAVWKSTAALKRMKSGNWKNIY